MNAPALHATNGDDYRLARRVSWWDPDAECTLVMSQPSIDHELWLEYLRGAERSYRKHGVERALDVPAIRVHTTDLTDLGLTAAGAMEVPEGATTAGWFALSPVPGEVGPAVLAAHVNYDKVPGVFARLHEMKVGDTAVVTRSDGSSVRFTAYRVERFSKSAFPTGEVYGNTEGPELRLVTCGGDFDRTAHSYRDNVVVFARMA